jgi:hypothetical protein
MNEVKPEIFQKVFCLAVSKWGYELVGGGICGINEKVAALKPLPELSGSFYRPLVGAGRFCCAAVHHNHLGFAEEGQPAGKIMKWTY